jgi:hypothetical protein
MKRVILVLALGTACTEPHDDPLACQQTYGFGNYGCADIAGTVTDTNDVPLKNVSVNAGGMPSAVFDYVQTTTDSLGHFALRLARHAPAPTDKPDTTSTWIRAVPTPSSARDSAQVHFEFARLKQRPTVVTTIIKVNLP